MNVIPSHGNDGVEQKQHTDIHTQTTRQKQDLNMTMTDEHLTYRQKPYIYRSETHKCEVFARNDMTLWRVPLLSNA